MDTVELKLQVKANDMPEFTKTLVEYDIDNEIIGHTEDNEMIVQIDYGFEQQDAVDELLEISEIFEDDQDEEIEEDEEDD
jgi:hypothetical protein